MSETPTQTQTVTQKKKNPAIAAVLAFFFGPFGLFYVNAGQAIVAFILWLITLVIGVNLAIKFIYPIARNDGTELAIIGLVLVMAIVISIYAYKAAKKLNQNPESATQNQPAG